MKPYFAFQWHITDDCDQRCKHCYIFAEDSGKRPDFMSWDEMRQVVDNCEDFCEMYDRQPYFYITGGDPILSPDFWPLLELLSVKRIPFTIMGNPFHLTDEVCERMKLLGCEKYQLSINQAQVGMTATETITTNPRVLAADPLVEYKKAKSRREKDVPGGIGEEDMVVLVLPYIRTAREGVARLGQLLETYGTYESNGIAFNDQDEVWWLETIGGHHWMARRVPDDVVVVNPNQFGMDAFDMEDAFGAQRDHLCSSDLREFIRDNRLDLNQNGAFNPRDVFGSHTDMDHIYNTPRAWFMGRYLCPRSHTWDGPGAEFTPESDNLPWALVPDRKVAVEDVKYMLSSHYQGTPYDPYAGHDTGVRGKYRSIGINRTGVTSICQIRSGAPESVRGVEWICFGSTAFDAALPVYANVPAMPKYLSDVTLDTSTENFYWGSRLIGALADAHYGHCVQLIERYQNAVAVKGRQIIREYDQKIRETGDIDLAKEANEKLCDMARRETISALNKVLHEASVRMKNGYNRADN